MLVEVDVFSSSYFLRIHKSRSAGTKDCQRTLIGKTLSCLGRSDLVCPKSIGKGFVQNDCNCRQKKIRYLPGKETYNRGGNRC